MNETKQDETRLTKSSCCCGAAEGSTAGNPERSAAGSPEAMASTLPEDEKIRTWVRERYSAWAEQDEPSSGCCSTAPGCSSSLETLGYSSEEAAAIPDGANLGLGCGNPLAFAQVQRGETVLDLGSGAGIDCFLAARAVGPTGRVIGVDMTPAMLSRARVNAAKVEATNVEFRLGEIEHLPVADASIDLIISNCVINLSPAKAQVFRDARRVLKPGGRMVVSDLVLSGPLDDELRQNVALYVGCVSGASTREEYLRLVREAGFSEVEILSETAFTSGQENFAPESPEWRAFQMVTSIKLRAVRT